MYAIYYRSPGDLMRLGKVKKSKARALAYAAEGAESCPNVLFRVVNWETGEELLECKREKKQVNIG